jgi:hypothetical protein
MIIRKSDDESATTSTEVQNTMADSVGGLTEMTSPWLLFGGIFFVASIGGIAALLRGKQKITQRAFWSACLNSGLLGVGIALLLFDRLPLHSVVAISILSGVGGASILDATIQAMRPKFGAIFSAVLSALVSTDSKKK